MKKTLRQSLWIPVAIGIVSGALILLASTARFLIPVGGGGFIGVGEMLTTLSAALGGPVAVVVMLLVTYGGGILLNMNLFTDPQAVYIALADATAHLCALLVVAVGYGKLLHPRARNMGIFLAGWSLTVGVYYFLAFVPLEVFLLNLVDPARDATYPSIAASLLPEFLATAVITTLIWFAAPARYRRPQWIEPKPMPDRSGRIQDA